MAAKLIQKMLWESSTEFGSQEMFFRGEGVEVDCVGVLRVPAGKGVSFDTWFNLFSAGKWKKYTKVESVSIYVTLCGRGVFSLIGLRENMPDAENVILQGIYDCDGFQEIAIFKDIDIEELYDFCFLRVEASSDTRIAQGWYQTGKSCPEEICDVDFACCICTYKREEYIRRNVSTLLREIVENRNSPLYGRLEIHIADNGRTLSGEECLRHPKVHIYPNENYGGSAGFARTMIEAVLYRQDSKLTHLLLMDDDILLYPTVVERTAAFVGLLREDCRNCILGGAMLLLEQREIQAEACGYYEVLTGSNRLSAPNGMDLTKRENLLYNDSANNVNFSG